MSLTLVGTRLAETDTSFVYRGEAPACADCPYRKQCLNLEKGVRYTVTDVRDGGQELECAVHDGGVLAVEVERVPFEANVPAKGAFSGSKITLAGPCPHTECPSHALCEPMGADFDREYRIEKTLGDPPHDYCALDRELERVELGPPERR
ncbi:putative metal binding protein [Halanaeroarchaeum sp. HSR-CO]|uniref:UPF0179 family protein n=1 Tax=Halanaeroarchaeum sp. HSR-CO TaxID=2866382 RepID=UPI00217E5D9C|nr:UPF0179 family protein [Halanaeroarchaeum sp. HSR-CO]UWG48423.1 putative metal binding protein [Halanaeroarchaeum sp. HSR-CO]